MLAVSPPERAKAPCRTLLPPTHAAALRAPASLLALAAVACSSASDFPWQAKQEANDGRCHDDEASCRADAACAPQVRSNGYDVLALADYAKADASRHEAADTLPTLEAGGRRSSEPTQKLLAAMFASAAADKENSLWLLNDYKTWSFIGEEEGRALVADSEQSKLGILRGWSALMESESLPPAAGQQKAQTQALELWKAMQALTEADWNGAIVWASAGFYSKRQGRTTYLWCVELRLWPTGAQIGSVPERTPVLVLRSEFGEKEQKWVGNMSGWIKPLAARKRALQDPAIVFVGGKPKWRVDGPVACALPLGYAAQLPVDSNNLVWCGRAQKAAVLGRAKELLDDDAARLESKIAEINGDSI